MPPVVVAATDPPIGDPSSAAANEVRAEEVDAAGPEGRPADPGLGPRALKSMVMIVAAAVIVAAVLVGVLVGPGLGLAIGGMGIVFLLINPVGGAAMMRSKDRARAEQAEADHRPRSR